MYRIIFFCIIDSQLVSQLISASVNGLIHCAEIQMFSACASPDGHMIIKTEIKQFYFSFISDVRSS